MRCNWNVNRRPHPYLIQTQLTTRNLPFSVAFDEVDCIDRTGATRTMIERGKVLYGHRFDTLRSAESHKINYVPLLYGMQALISEISGMIQYAIPVQTSRASVDPDTDEDVILSSSPLRDALFVRNDSSGAVQVGYVSRIRVESKHNETTYIHDELNYSLIKPDHEQWSFLTQDGHWEPCWEALIKAAACLAPQLIQITHEYGD